MMDFDERLDTVAPTSDIDHANNLCKLYMEYKEKAYDMRTKAVNAKDVGEEYIYIDTSAAYWKNSVICYIRMRNVVKAAGLDISKVYGR